jgi:hypothetical protein
MKMTYRENRLVRSLNKYLIVFLALLLISAAAVTADDAFLTVKPTEIKDPITNPYAGWGIWAGPRDWEFKNYSAADNTSAYPDDAPLFSWVMVDWNWSDIEKTEGQYNWSDFDQVYQYWTSRGKQLVVRLWVTDDAGWNGDPGTNPIPDWLWTNGLHSREYKGNGGVQKREPDYMDPSYSRVYLPALKKLLAAFAERYDKAGTPVEFLQVMGYGHWADWATWYSHYPFPSKQAKHDLLAEIMRLHIETFHHIRLFEFAGADWDRSQLTGLDDQIYTKALDVALDHGFGLIWTGFIDGVGGWDRELMNRYWKRVPIIAEDNWDYLEIKDQGIHGTLDENLDLMLEYHANLAHYYVRSATYGRAMREDRANFERGLRIGGLGYRLAPVSLQWKRELPAGDLMMLKQEWVNRNVGWLPVQHPLKIYLTNEAGQERFSEIDKSIDETSWVSGERYKVTSVFHLPKELAPGTYDVRLALVDAAGTPRINLAIAGADSSKRYKVGTVRILPARKQTGCDKAYCP